MTDVSPIHPQTTEPEADLLTIDGLHQFAYCPRRFHLMHVDGRWDDNAYTEDGRNVHRRVDQLDHVLPDPGAPPDTIAATAESGGDEPPAIARSVNLASERLGLVGKLDLVSTAGDEAAPVERKRGAVPNNPEQSWEPERVQLMAQGLLLREHGYRCDHGLLYYAASRRRVTVPFTAELEARALQLLDLARIAARQPQPPLPLDDSPKCHGCSLAAICLPDETLALLHVPPDPAAPAVRRFYPARDDALPLYIQEQGAVVGKEGDAITVSRHGARLARVPLKDLSQLVLCGNVGITAQATHLLCEAAIPIVHLSMGHWFYGITTGLTLRNAFARLAQFQTAADPARCLAFAQTVVAAKGANQRTVLRRNASPRPDDALERMHQTLEHVAGAPDLEGLLGLEGSLAADYFANFNTLLADGPVKETWQFTNRNRRPPRDPLNSLLSFGYALLAKETTVALLAEGLDPWYGLYHQPRHGRPALALDLMEEFRPLVVDSAVLSAVNTGMVKPEHFITSAAGCVMSAPARKAFIQAYEARLDQFFTHPLFDYRCSWRAIIRLQARLLTRWLRGEIPQYPPITTR